MRSNFEGDKEIQRVDREGERGSLVPFLGRVGVDEGAVLVLDLQLEDTRFQLLDVLILELELIPQPLILHPHVTGIIGVVGTFSRSFRIFENLLILILLFVIGILILITCRCRMLSGQGSQVGRRHRQEHDFVHFGILFDI